MIESRVSTKYATALFRTAKRAGQVQTIADELDALSDLFRRNPELRSLLESPQVLEKQKEQLLNSTLKTFISDALLSFLMLVLSKHRIQYLLPICEQFQRLVREDQGILEACLITARDADQALLDQVKRELEASTGKKVEVRHELDRHLIGGIVVILGDKIIDRSIRFQLNQLREQMSALKVHEIS